MAGWQLGLARRLVIAVGALFACAIMPAAAQQGGDAIKARVGQIVDTLLNGTDAEFEALRDRCIVHQGRRICPGSDREPDASAGADAEPAQEKTSDLPELERSGARGAVTFVPGVRGDATTFTALEDLIRLRLEEGRLSEAARHARELGRLVDQAREEDVRPSALTVIGRALLSTGQPAEADRFLRRALDLEVAQNVRGLAERTDTAPADVLSGRMALMLSGLAEVAEAQQKADQARRLHQRALVLSLDPHNADVLKAFGLFEWRQSRPADAADLLARSLKLQNQFWGPSTSAADTANALGHIALAQGRLEEALRRFQEAASTSTQIALTGADDPMFHQRDGDYIARQKRLFEDVVAGALQLAERSSGDHQRLAAESFTAAQWAERTSAAAAISRMAARIATHDAELSGLVREFDGLLAERQQLEKQLLTRLAAQDMPAANAARSRIAAAEARARAVQSSLSARFPKYAALAYPQPASLPETQALLADNEALVQFLFTEDDGYAWGLTHDRTLAVHLPVGGKWVAEHVAILRCGLDDGEWRLSAGRWVAENERCAGLEGERNAWKQLPFKSEVAHELYVALFGRLEPLIAGRSLMVVPAGALSALPLHVLVTSPPPASTDYRSVAWLVKRQSLSVLPSAAALGALRRSRQALAPAPRPFLGIGNPLLTGLDSVPEDARRAALAQRKQDCAPSPPRTLTASLKSTSGMRALLRGGTADVAAIRVAIPLPETADELCAVARTLGAEPADVLLGARATEAAVKTMSASGALKSYRVVHFATHGLLASDTESVGRIAPEPALLLTPPESASEEDDGLLTASEVARLDLAADWVILSACNTAAGNADGGEALSGLGRAFFYAGARALLVSHWPVNSDATVKLVTKALSRMAVDTSISRSEALRRSMLELIAAGPKRDAHPAYWAPFVVVGEGGGAESAPLPAATGSIRPPGAPPLAKSPRRRVLNRAAAPDWRREIWRP